MNKKECNQLIRIVDEMPLDGQEESQRFADSTGQPRRGETALSRRICISDVAGSERTKQIANGNHDVFKGGRLAQPWDLQPGRSFSIRSEG